MIGRCCVNRAPRCSRSARIGILNPFELSPRLLYQGADGVAVIGSVTEPAIRVRPEVAAKAPQTRVVSQFEC